MTSEKVKGGIEKALTQLISAKHPSVIIPQKSVSQSNQTLEINQRLDFDITTQNSLFDNNMHLKLWRDALLDEK